MALFLQPTRCGKPIYPCLLSCPDTNLSEETIQTSASKVASNWHFQWLGRTQTRNFHLALTLAVGVFHNRITRLKHLFVEKHVKWSKRTQAPWELATIFCQESFSTAISEHSHFVRHGSNGNSLLNHSLRPEKSHRGIVHLWFHIAKSHKYHRTTPHVKFLCLWSRAVAGAVTTDTEVPQVTLATSTPQHFRGIRWDFCNAKEVAFCIDSMKAT